MKSSVTRKKKLIFSDLIEIQKNSFRWFLEEALVKEFDKLPAITDPLGKIKIKFCGKDYKITFPKFDIEKAKRNDHNYTAELFVPVKMTELDTGKIEKVDVFMGEVPLMTNEGTFILNGIERVVVNQIVRSPGVYYKSDKDKKGLITYSATLISMRGAFLKFETDKKNLIWARIDKTRKFPAHILLNAMGVTNDQIYEMLMYPHYFQETIDKFGHYSESEALIEVYAQLRGGESSTIEDAKKLLYSRFLDPRRYDLGKIGRKKLNQKLRLNIPANITNLTAQDMLAAIDYLINLVFNIGSTDDIDHLKNRRVRSVGELLQIQLQLGLNHLENIILDRLKSLDLDPKFIESIKIEKLAPLIDPKPISSSLKEFFGSNQLSQFMDQINPLSELTHKRRLTILGPGGLSRDRIALTVRNIHPSYYGRLCPFETPEGQNAGLICSLAIHAYVNLDGFIETPFYPVKNGYVLKDLQPEYLTADEEEKYKIAAGDISIDKKNFIQGKLVPIRYRQEFTITKPNQVDYVAVSPVQVLSVSTSLIPFLEHDDANRALMGSNMQRQAVPLLYPKRPLIGTGLETHVAKYSTRGILNKNEGQIIYVSSEKICVKNLKGEEDIYLLKKYQRSNQETCLNQRPIVCHGEYVRKGQLLADGPAMQLGDLALGQNLLVAYMSWEGYNYEDAILINEQLVYNDIFTSIHIGKYEIERNELDRMSDEILKEIPNINEFTLRHLDEYGIVRVGAWVEAGDILVAKIVEKDEVEPPSESKLLRAILGENLRDFKDYSLRMPIGEKGRVIDVHFLTKEYNNDLGIGSQTTTLIRIYVAQKRKIQVGDKMAGRHGNKGIISKILPRQDMPYLPDGSPIEMILNPLGVPSRMNVGQVFECLLGWAVSNLDIRIKLLPFDEMYGKDASQTLVREKLERAKKLTGKDWLLNNNHYGKIQIFDGRSGEPFSYPVTIGKAYILKLVHLVDDKMHARSTGPYSLITQQPLGGKSKQGGQRFGEMEVWALEAFGASYNLQELITLKSDDMQGRKVLLNAIIKGKSMPRPSTPESFRVLLQELQALCLDIYTEKENIHIEEDEISKDTDLQMDIKDELIFDHQDKLDFNESFLLSEISPRRNFDSN
uniref:DNA-directed RNA polymerase subunit beta n=1 Tax=Glaucocystis sp. BBH TaxID=2023628 RepID=A0A3G1IUT6_9EUKA|nr:RNA polymerase beta subunit [Glaucocystis sp. BBH]